MSSNPRLYSKVVLKGNNTAQNIPGTKTYKGFSTVSGQSPSFSLFDLALIKQDLINHFHTRMGERLENPEFGTIIWDLLFEPMTPEIRQVIVQNVQQIINYDPRLTATSIVVSTYETGIQIECTLVYHPYNIQEKLQLRFDQVNGLLVN